MSSSQEWIFGLRAKFDRFRLRLARIPAVRVPSPLPKAGRGGRENFAFFSERFSRTPEVQTVPRKILTFSESSITLIGLIATEVATNRIWNAARQTDGSPGGNTQRVDRKKGREGPESRKGIRLRGLFSFQAEKKWTKKAIRGKIFEDIEKIWRAAHAWPGHPPPSGQSGPEKSRTLRIDNSNASLFRQAPAQRDRGLACGGFPPWENASRTV